MPFEPFADNRAPGPTRQGMIALGLVVVLSIVLVSAWTRDDGTGLLRQIQGSFQSLISPITQLGTLAATPAENASEALGDAMASDETLSQLQQENAELTSRLAQLEEYQSENERLNGLLGIQSLYGFESVGARVIGTTDDTYSRTLTIDKGTADGVQVGMAVMSSSGLVGQVISAGSGSAVVRLATDPQSGIAAMLQSSRATGVVSGGTDGLLHLEYIAATTKVSVGDIVITSGLGGVYPKGIVIGTVVSVTGEETDVDQTIVVQPVVAYSIPEEVLVVTGAETEVDTPTVSELTAVAEGGSATASDASSSSGDEGANGTAAASDDEGAYDSGTLTGSFDAGADAEGDES